MRTGRLPLWLSLLLAVATGVLPLRECRPTDGCGGGIVLAGCHGHAPDGHDASDDGSDRKTPGPGDCIDTAMTLAAPAAPLALDAPTVALAAPGASLAPVTVAFLSTVEVLPDPGDVPPGVRGVVLLR